MKRLSGFSLMEMMIVLTIVAIVAAASAPMVNKKMVSSNGQSVWTRVNGGIAYNQNSDNLSVLIGRGSPIGLDNTRLYIQTNDKKPHMSFAYKGKNTIMKFAPGDVNGNIILSDEKADNASNSVIIGQAAQVSGSSAIVIGNSPTASNNGALAIGAQASALGGDSIAIGSGTTAAGTNSVAIGNGSNTGAAADNSVAIGNGISVTESDQIVLGDGNSTVVIDGTLKVQNLEFTDLYVPGNLTVGKYTKLGTDSAYDGKYRVALDVLGLTRLTMRDDGAKDIYKSRTLGQKDGGHEEKVFAYDNVGDKTSDRRLKNVGKSFQGGLAELKKLDLYHYTFKDDKAKTPRVGVMAQDLKKIFPDAVTKGEDGFLRIRMEDMFYAVINAVKELDTRTSALEQKQKKIDELEKRIEQLEKQLAKKN